VDNDDYDNITCLTCHETLTSDHESGTAHNNRVIDELCSHCHTSDTTTLGQPGNGTLASDEDVNILHRSDCILCHNYAGTEMDAAIVAQAILDGVDGAQISCLTCHNAGFEEIHAVLENHTSLINVGDTSCGN
jgi:hypothetical protein